MHRLGRLLLAVGWCAVTVLVVVGLTTPSQAQDDTEELAAEVRGPIVSQSVIPGSSRAVRDLPVAQRRQPGEPPREIAPIASGDAGKAQGEGKRIRDPLLSTGFAPELPGTPDPLISFAGLNRNESGNYFPPDTIGDVGPNHYVQMVNVAFAIYDKQGTLLAGPVAIGELWREQTDPALQACSQDYGDPIVLYDEQADRWLLSQFAFPNGRDTPPWYECIAISQTPDPMDGYYLYAIETTVWPDYPKLGVWPDAYYMVSNSNGFPNVGVYAFDRARMLAGEPATVQEFQIGNRNLLMPADLDGATPPPAGTPGYFYTAMDDTYWPQEWGIPGEDRVELWAFAVDFDQPANTTFTKQQDIPIAAYNYLNPFSGNIVPQKGTDERLDALAGWPMWRLQYRNQGSHESLVGNFSVDVNGTRLIGIRWFELRKTGDAPWVLHQEGTHAPDADYRWMGSIAMDGAGNIALGYSVSGFDLFPSIRYAARLASDPPGTLRREATLMAGSAPQLTDFPGARNRWGDYSSMNVDPVDDCTFWYTTEYLRDSGEGWRTHIGAFRFPECGSGVALTKSVNDLLPLPGQTITYTLVAANNNNFALTNAVISDTLPTELDFVGPVTLMPPQTGAVLAQDVGDLPTLAQGITVTAGAAVTLTFPVQVRPDVLAAEILNIATLTSTEILTPTTGAARIVVGPRLALTKTVNTTEPTVGDVLTYTITVANSGSTSATNAVITDTLPSGVAFRSPVTLDPPQPGAIVAQEATDLPVLVRNLTLAPGERITVTLPVEVDLNLPTETRLVNTAGVTSVEIQTPVVATVQATALRPNLSVNKEGSDPFPVAGQTVTYMLGVFNTARGQATDVVLTDTLPTGLTLAGPVRIEFFSGSGVPIIEADGQTITVRGITLTSFTFLRLHYPVRVDVAVPIDTSLVNEVVVTSRQQPGPVVATAPLIVNPPRATLLFEDFATASGTTPPNGWFNDIITGDITMDRWRFDNPGRRFIFLPLTEPAAIFDSEFLSLNSQPENVALVSPVIDATHARRVIVEFDQSFLGGGAGGPTNFTDPQGEVFVEVFNGRRWRQVYRRSAAVDRLIDHQRLAIGAAMDGVRNARLRFRWTGFDMNYWVVDNVRLSGTLAPAAVTVSGPDSGFIGVPYTFTAAVSPTNVTTPTVYRWQPEPFRGQGTTRATYIWAETGPHTVTLRATNAWGSAAGSTTITLNPPALTLDASTATPGLNTPVVFTATVSPVISPVNLIAFDFGDGSNPFEVAVPIAGTGQFTATHSYTRTGSYTPTATLVADVYGGDVVSNSMQVQVVYGPAASMAIEAGDAELPADGVSTTQITAVLSDTYGNALPGQTVAFTTTAGTIRSTAVTDAAGVASVALTAGTVPATATVTASLGTLQASVDVRFVAVPEPVTRTLELTATTTTLLAGPPATAGTTLVTATLREGRAALANQQVVLTIAPGTGARFVVSGNTVISPTHTLTATTDANGQVVALLRAGLVSGPIQVTAAGPGGLTSARLEIAATLPTAARLVTATVGVSVTVDGIRIRLRQVPGSLAGMQMLLQVMRPTDALSITTEGDLVALVLDIFFYDRATDTVLTDAFLATLSEDVVLDLDYTESILVSRVPQAVGTGLVARVQQAVFRTIIEATLRVRKQDTSRPAVANAFIPLAAEEQPGSALVLDTDNNRVTFPLEQFGRYVLAGQDAVRLYLPVIRR